MRRFIEPNKPIRTNEGFLDEIDDSYVADVKLDGWRTEISKFNNELHYLSRVNKPLDVPTELRNYFQKNLPEGMIIDAEWINKSRLKAINTHHGSSLPILDCMVIFDIKWMDGKYIAGKTLSERRDISFYKNLPVIDLDNIKDNTVYQTISVTGDNSKKLYDIQKTQPLSEGIVLKRKSGKLDSNWYKIRYRE